MRVAAIDFDNKRACIVNSAWKAATFAAFAGGTQTTDAGDRVTVGYAVIFGDLLAIDDKGTI